MADNRHVSKVGEGTLVYPRVLEGPPTTATIRRSSTGNWYSTFACEGEPTALPPMVGIDVGLNTCAPCSDAHTIDNPR